MHLIPCTMDKLKILKLATGIYFTDMREFLSTLHSQLGREGCSLEELEAFLTASIDFNMLPLVKEQVRKLPCLLCVHF